MNAYKRVNASSFGTETQVDETTAALQSLGMRIRKSVADGYMVPQNGQNAFNDYNSRNGGVVAPNIQRVPLPERFANNPPSLTYNGSTASSLAGWENELERPVIHQMSASGTSPIKRGREDDSGESEYVNVHHQKNLSDYVGRYGQLSFNEDF
ncbi:unnamed protein product [Kuraishia capsulata CBS 1993]|uniref:Damage-regulated import facilitator 1 n=1 Tax=Kuraishia capsulata CBS 1993 TaxID=1382522 RepID=W6MQQ5_9ASCO|nr:uncharacterized protein KUCA_T00000185001 [Kuraishia capsulata CBS 1993]CDK24225.1 unnamed protein product [Kuraishia capsulata CBS 1993]